MRGQAHDAKARCFGEFGPREKALSHGPVKEDAGNIQRELKRLEKVGFLFSEKQGNTKVYFTNKQFPIFLDQRKCKNNGWIRQFDSFRCW